MSQFGYNPSNSSLFKEVILRLEGLSLNAIELFMMFDIVTNSFLQLHFLLTHNGPLGNIRAADEDHDGHEDQEDLYRKDENETALPQ